MAVCQFRVTDDVAELRERRVVRFGGYGLPALRRVHHLTDGTHGDVHISLSVRLFRLHQPYYAVVLGPGHGGIHAVERRGSRIDDWEHVVPERFSPSFHLVRLVGICQLFAERTPVPGRVEAVGVESAVVFRERWGGGVLRKSAISLHGCDSP